MDGEEEMRESVFCVQGGSRSSVECGHPALPNRDGSICLLCMASQRLTLRKCRFASMEAEVHCDGISGDRGGSQITSNGNKVIDFEDM